MLNRPAGKMVGRSFPKGFTDASEDAIEFLFNQVKAMGHAEDIVVRTLVNEATFNFGATLLKREDGVFFLVRISPHKTGDQPPANRALMDVVQRSPDALVVTDPEGRILTANTAFLELCQLGSEQLAQQQPLDRWIGRAGVDVEMLRKNLLQRNQVKQFTTTLKPEFEEPIDVELSAVAALDAEVPCLGFVIRQNIRRAPVTAPDPDQPFARSLQDMTDLIGRVPLRDLVRETSDIIERLCIEAALRATNDNRASAAELLGLSRQSLYVKLRRYGLEDFTAEKKA
jgi:transcriptional regulator PpsR